jgi:hypothetical protein
MLVFLEALPGTYVPLIESVEVVANIQQWCPWRSPRLSTLA